MEKLSIRKRDHEKNSERKHMYIEVIRNKS